ncbi:MAG: hypothetical protein A2268_08650 [Candidatus Raymondbacteria bacterium RifOxyA12_full_50_37]|uniref:DUF3108 domain-containing protein n=1 Tax=Candidatus Raymondbacteria bacterium RIFOXYD12_FULL_49_13 TaxID=1817890 RepID=A0A1F7EZU9_UNCRA|nr:MAG: hypothetical protein A2268_08650 [Candidatus Raymondbacteria bacterium RifOxyA12_full_50_37]OGJ92681.1 MAG: hypothetical protein A2248_07675 [Candidatus Raymondbacteria bacterium RIFOXYA2_FULL_49_16]OGJ93083.1 MAG: hypothetical protein A2487_10170 [Candidatus Raymondbacteria bacterium RifOxyC12_full_50_8]OGJ99026.1 MAG: hypothetical protein A2453_06075 [Candidatus Raymondbacteria bacterium RIFOXYC2_FULL_50_21]OGJ99394.1 MAG: hypothetical protein A2350_03795 [Candidatus Raymondbacteria b
MGRILFLCLLAIYIHGQDPLRHVENKVFGPDERFIFNVSYGFIHGGFASLEIQDTARINGHLCHKIRAVAHSSAALSIFFPVRDTNYSYMDVEGLFSRKIIKYIREGNYKQFKWAFFEPEIRRATTRDTCYTTLPFVQDVVSSFYYFRLFNVKDSLDINCFDDKKNYPMRVKVVRKEKIKTLFGKIECRVVEPLLTSSGIFMKKGRLLIWLTDDARKIPVKVTFKLPFLGHITCTLEKHFPGSIIAQSAPPVQ